MLFVCVHNAGRSQMAAGYLRHLAGDRVEVLSAGSQPADQVNPLAVAAMAEEGIDITGENAQDAHHDAVRAADVVVTMGCGDACPFYPGKRYEDWVLDDPAGQAIEAVRPDPRRDQAPGREAGRGARRRGLGRRPWSGIRDSQRTLVIRRTGRTSARSGCRSVGGVR